MRLSIKPVEVDVILPWRDRYRQIMNCQIIYDSLHGRSGWTESYLFEVDGAASGYGALMVGGPWKGTRIVFEFYVSPQQQSHAFDLFDAFVSASGATGIETQTNDVLLTAMLHARAQSIVSTSIVFHDVVTTNLPAPDAILRSREEPDSDWAIEINGAVVASGGILFHYNRPYGDIYMKVAEDFRLRGLGSYIVQELKRICYSMGSVPCARCNTGNVASRKTLQKAGFVPCAHILAGAL